MYQLIYVSIACEPFSQQRLRRLLESARAKNTRLGVTGMLLYKKDSFMQALEGDADAVQALYNQICDDSRHESVRLLMSAPAEERDFPDWAMGFENVDNVPPDEMPEGYMSLADERFTTGAFTDDPSFAHRMLLGFKNRSFT